MVKKSEHPLPQRLFHWVNLVSVGMLIITGLMIHSPAEGDSLGTIIYIHLTFAYLFLANGFGRVYYSFFGKYRDFPEFALGPRDWKPFWETVRYYLFLGPLIHRTKYNPLQKLAYLFLILFGLVQAVTGLAMLFPTGPFAFVNGITGGLAGTWFTHYLVMWIFIAIIIVHLYLVFTEPTSSVKLMLFGSVPEEGSQTDRSGQMQGGSLG